MQAFLESAESIIWILHGITMIWMSLIESSMSFQLMKALLPDPRRYYQDDSNRVDLSQARLALFWDKWT